MTVDRRPLLPAARRKLPVPCCPLPAARCQPPAAFCFQIPRLSAHGSRVLEEAVVALSSAAAAWPVIAVMGDRSNQACEGRSSICRKTS